MYELLALLLGLMPWRFTAPKATPLEVPLAAFPWGL